MKKRVSAASVFLTCVLLLNLVSCIKNDSEQKPVVDKCSGQAGPMFTAVKTLITQRCVSCHNSTRANGGMNFTVDCNIINAQANIKSAAVDLGYMPPTGPLPQADKDKITSWIKAGGAITN